MATPFLGLRTCIYRIPDTEMATASDWYSKAFETKPYYSEAYYVGFNIGGFELGLHPRMEAKAGGENVETYWGVDDIQASFSQLLAAGASAHQKPNEVGGDIWVAMVKDPWDNIIGIIQNPHFSAK